MTFRMPDVVVLRDRYQCRGVWIDGVAVPATVGVEVLYGVNDVGKVQITMLGEARFVEADSDEGRALEEARE